MCVCARFACRSTCVCVLCIFRFCGAFSVRESWSVRTSTRTCRSVVRVRTICTRKQFYENAHKDVSLFSDDDSTRRSGKNTFAVYFFCCVLVANRGEGDKLELQKVLSPQEVSNISDPPIHCACAREGHSAQKRASHFLSLQCRFGQTCSTDPSL